MQPCKAPLCPELVAAGFCDSHRADHRPKRHGTKVYNSKRWKLLRRKKLNANPICEECEKELATEVDHVVDIHTRPDLAFTWSNLRSLCSPCHGTKTNAEVRSRTYG